MIRTAGAWALLLSTLATGAAAQSFKGAELSGEILAFSATDVMDHGYRGSLEFGVFGSFGVQADLGFYDLEDRYTARNVTIHVVYDAFDLATLGAFHARESVEDAEAATLWGLEAGKSLGPIGGEAYVAFGDAEAGSFRTFGFDAAFDLAPALSLTASGAGLDTEGTGASRLSLGGEYRFGERGPAVYAEIGRLSADGAEPDRFIGLGARIAIGPNRGTTFESRGINEVLAGF